MSSWPKKGQSLGIVEVCGRLMVNFNLLIINYDVEVCIYFREHETTWNPRVSSTRMRIYRKRKFEISLPRIAESRNEQTIAK